MPELMESKEKKVIAFYLPQFHRIPENDQWWGEGFTEWTNTKKAKPLFDGHYQPKTPLNEDYYDLSDVTVMERQATLAKEYGLYGFCYYHYWFKNGKKLLEKPVENMLNDPKVDIPFCLCWANENWTRNWDGGNFEVIAEQEYGNQAEWEKHFDYLLPFFKDDRYIKYQGKPLMVIYKPEIIDDFDRMMSCWKERARKKGLPGLIILRQFPFSYFDPLWNSENIDYTIKFEPAFSNSQRIHLTEQLQKLSNKRRLKKIVGNVLNRLGLKTAIKKRIIDLERKDNRNKRQNKELDVFGYDEAWRIILDDEPYGNTLINGAFVNWDNTSRNKNGRLYKGSTPEKFQMYFFELLNKPTAINCIFINAWNEWAEGAYLEPDEKYEYAYLEALSNALNRL